jgi:hypothetical protein
MHAHLSALQAVFSASAEYYDLVYGKKDYQGEADRLRAIFIEPFSSQASGVPARPTSLPGKTITERFAD